MRGSIVVDGVDAQIGGGADGRDALVCVVVLGRGELGCAVGDGDVWDGEHAVYDFCAVVGEEVGSPEGAG